MESKETSRLEAFSDGVIAIAITLLVLEIKVPTKVPTELHEGTGLWSALGQQWPSYLALVTSFTLVLILF